MVSVVFNVSISEFLLTKFGNRLSILMVYGLNTDYVKYTNLYGSLYARQLIPQSQLQPAQLITGQVDSLPLATPK